jgi:DNA-directed RNA polymerase subunit RPC12/RpoP
MAQKTQGYVNLYWKCPHCGAQNIGKVNVCAQCGSPQPDNVEFYQLEGSQILQDVNEIKQAQSGPDIYCPYCGSRNTAGTKECIQCGGDIAEGKRRQSGQIVGSFKEGQKQTISCPSCNVENAFDRTTCHQCGTGLAVESSAKSQPQSAQPQKKIGTVGIVFAILFAALFCGFVVWGISGLLSKEEVTATVENVEWQYTVNIERYGPTESQDWQSEIPSNANIVSCEDQYRYEETDYVEGSVEVCGTPYSVDKGNGYAEVVQDCVYQVYEPYCRFEVMDWAYDTSYTANGFDLNPSMPSYSLSSDQRVSEESVAYIVDFTSNGKNYEYQTEDFDEFAACKPGSEWILTTNAFDAILSIEPAN